MDGQENEQRNIGGEVTPETVRARRRWRLRPRIGRPGVRLRRLGTVLALLVVTLAGTVGGTYAGGHLGTDIGPFRAQISLTPSLSGGTTIAVPPLGALLLDSHNGPAYLTVELGSLDQRRTEALLDDPASISRASQSAVEDVRAGVMRLGLKTLASAVLATLLLAGLVFRDVRRMAWAGGMALVITAGSLGLAVATIRPQSIEEPRYEGLLVNAPAIVGDARRIANDYTKYAEQLQRMVGNVSKLYTTVSALPVYEPAPGTTRVLHVSDMHLNPTGWSLIRTIVEQFGIDVVIDTGDITDWGSEPEASFVGSIGLLKKPYVYIRGNHDSARTAAAVAQQPNAIVLDNSTTTVSGLTIAGIGDPRFTPDKETSPAGSGLTPQVADQVIGAGEQLATTVVNSPKQVNIALVHDPASAGPLSGTTPLVLAGHTHVRQVSKLPEVPGKQPTQLMVEGSTGGAGLRGLEGEKPTPLTMTVLYFDQQKLLQAYDDITVGGTGQSQVNLERHVIQEPEKGAQVPVTPTPSRGGPVSPVPPGESVSPTPTGESESPAPTPTATR
ncbi:metallophosphoesterase family protein [Micromonospora sp. SL4-19]|uniref:metallophosphoesterase family protein n=1 Tax=Micromonospora sp. SL4-19 TaxID=3399129 RepID=UPI003A4D5DA0